MNVAAVNKVPVDLLFLQKLYVLQEMSIPQVSKILEVSRSTVRGRLLEAGLLRSRLEGVRLASKKGLLGSGLRGKSRTLNAAWRKKISDSKRLIGEESAKGFTIKPNGYVEYTRGENKGRSVHVVAMEKSIGRRLRPNEVVHHIDHDRSNNELSNLMLMSRSEHSSLHATENVTYRKRNHHGKFE